jgi:hypothetical protein
MGGSDTKLNIIVDAQDKTDSAFSGVKSNLDQTKVSLDGITDAMNSVGKVGAVAFAGLSAGVALSLNEATEANKVLAQLDAVLGSTAGKAGVTKEAAIDLADSLAKVTLFTDDAILSAENLMLTFTDVSSEVFPEAIATALDMSTALGQDLQSSVTQLGKALNDPIDGISALSRVGVQFTDDQKAMIETLVDAGDTMSAQQIILEELNTEFGNSAELAANADPFGMLKNSVGELTEAIGTALLPTLQSFLDKLQPIIDKAVLWAQENPELVDTLTKMLAVITGLMAIMLPLSWIIPVLTGASTLFGLSMLATTGYAAGILAFILLLTFAMIQISSIVKLVGTDWNTIWLGIQLTFAGVVNTIITAFESMINWIIDGINKVIGLVNSLLDKLASIPKIGDAFAGLKIDELEQVVLNKIDTDGIVDNFIGSQQPIVNNTVNINGGTYLDPDVATEIGDMFIDTLGLSTNI